MPKRKYRRFKRKGTTLKELSGVDKPAQEGATMAIMKRAQDEPTVEKRVRLTSSNEGHAHLVYDDSEEGGTTSWQVSEGAESGHDHPWVRNDDGSITIGASDGHTHSLLEVVSKTETDSGGTGEDLTAVQKAETKETEMAKENETKIEKEDPVVYTAANGDVFRKSDDPRMVNAAKRADVAEERALTLELQKRAQDEIPNLPGDLDVHVAMLKAIGGISDEETRKSATESLHAASNAMAKAFVKVGSTKEETDGSPKAEIDALSKKLAEDKGISFEKAQAMVLETPEGQALYIKHVQAN